MERSSDEPIFEQEPERSIADTYDLPADQFVRWWNMLDPTDRDEFRWLYQGDELLARFVCALDLLLIAKIQSGDHASLVQLAYHIASKPYPKHRLELSDADLRIRATRAYNHEAVQSLLERVRARNRYRERLRIENLMLKGAEEMIRDASERDDNGNPKYDMKDRKAAMDVGLRIMELTDADQARVQQERTRKGLERARKAALEGDAHDVDDPRVIGATVRAIAAKIGRDKVLQLIAGEAPKDQTPHDA